MHISVIGRELGISRAEDVKENGREMEFEMPRTNFYLIR